MIQRINSTQASYIILSHEVEFYNKRINKMLAERLESNVKRVIGDD